MPGKKAPKQDTPVSSTPALRPTDAAAALQAIRPEIDALEPQEIVGIRCDVPRAAATALGAYAKIASYRSEIVEHLPKQSVEPLDKLETYAAAALYAHLTVVADEDALKALVAEATPLREGLLVAAEALAHRGLFNKQRVADIRSGQGQIDLANDLVGLGGLFGGAWSAIQGSTAVTRAEVDRAAVLGLELLTALGAREQGPTPISQGKDLRARAFTLFARAYDACRRALVYLRWAEGDVDTIAPSLFRFRVSRKPGRRDQVVEEDSAASPVTDDPTPVPPAAVQPTPSNGAPV